MLTYKRKLTKKVPHYKSTAILISILAFTAVWMATPAITLETPQTTRTGHPHASESLPEPDLSGIPYISKGNSLTMKVTGFSSVECKTTWCRANAGQPRGKKVALNAKYGKAQQVYIPKFDKTYDVIGTTDYKTDLDVWFGDDQQAALNHGSQYLEVKIIR